MDENMYDILLTEYGFTPEQIDRLMEAGVLSGEAEGILPRQYAMAQEMRGARQPRGRQVGDVYTAANPLEHIGSGLQRITGIGQDIAAQQRQAQILREQASRRGEYLRGMGGRRSAVPGTTPTWTMNQMYR